jgi:HTH-type transcriptional regulator/antitoxin HipB
MAIRTVEQLGAVIRLRRKALNLTQSDLALASGTGLRFIVDLEKGKPTCHIGKALAVLQSLGLVIQITPSAAESARGDKP